LERKLSKNCCPKLRRGLTIHSTGLATSSAFSLKLIARRLIRALGGYKVSKMKHLMTCALSLLLLTGIAATNGVSRSLLADKFPAGITGRLTDPSGAVIVGARIRIIARSTQKAFSFETNPEGEYVANLDPDVYDVEAEAVGFKKAKRKAIPVLREARSFVDFMLEPTGETTDSQHP
jgi:hypothetical protein